MQLQSPPVSPHGHGSVHPAYLYSMNERKSSAAGAVGGEGAHNIQRRRSENYRERPSTVGVPERRGGYKQHSISPQPKSDSYLQYQIQERGLIPRRDGGVDGGLVHLQPRQSPQQQFSPSGAEVRTFHFEDMDYPRDGYNSSSRSPYGCAPAEEQYQQNGNEQR